MNTNIGEMPLEIFCDYVTEKTGQEWTIETLVCSVCLYGHKQSKTYGNGMGFTQSFMHNAYGQGINSTNIASGCGYKGREGYRHLILNNAAYGYGLGYGY